MPTREDAWALVCEYTANENLRKHALAVEACVRAYARAYARAGAADEELWGLTALLHDFDYERWPNQGHHPSEGHPSSGAPLLRQAGYPEEMIHAILAHADYTGVLRRARRWTVRCVRLRRDGRLPHGAARGVRKPARRIFEESKPDSVKRKMKDDGVRCRASVLRGYGPGRRTGARACRSRRIFASSWCIGAIGEGVAGVGDWSEKAGA